jgi:Asp-tRNA(Asn)/Glu-tRNA(Gln) amidotransferase C subunit
MRQHLQEERRDARDTLGIELEPGGFEVRLRDDAVTERDNREANQRSAPAVDNGLFLVPKVIE